MIINYSVYNRRYIEHIWIQDVLALTFANAFEITKFANTLSKPYIEEVC